MFTTSIALQVQERGEINMKYILAFGLGVPGVLVCAWFLMNNL